MFTTDDRDYYAQRERECVMLAGQARHPNARAAHLQLAALHARRAREASGTDRG